MANRLFPSQPTSLDVSKDGKAIFVGTGKGVFRAFDVTDRKKPRLIKQIKFYNDGEPITGLNSSDGNTVVVTSSESNRIWFMS